MQLDPINNVPRIGACEHCGNQQVCALYLSVIPVRLCVDETCGSINGFWADIVAFIIHVIQPYFESIDASEEVPFLVYTPGDYLGAVWFALTHKPGEDE